MQTLPTAILHHAQAPSPAPPIHYDWLVTSPVHTPPALARLADHRLTTFRCNHPPQDWATLGRFTLTPLTPHRARYLRYQGPVSGARGHVTRVDHGHAIPLIWSDSRIHLILHTRSLRTAVELRRLAPDRWLATLFS